MKRNSEEQRHVTGKGFCLSALLGLSMMEVDVVLGFICGPDSAGLMAGLSDLRGLFQPKRFHDSEMTLLP